MFDLNDKNTTRVIEDKSVPEDATPAGETSAPQMHVLDTPDYERLHRTLLGYHRQELDRQSENRYQMAIDEDYHDNIQWSEADAQELRDRGQAPVVYNVGCQTINWIIGSEKRSRMDFNVLPRSKEDAKPAQTKRKLFKYFSDVNRTEFNRSRAFEDCVKVGLGWVEDGAQDEDEGSEVLFNRYESWRNILWDSSSTEYDLADCRYLFRDKWLDEDVLGALAPDRLDIIQRSTVDGIEFGVSIDNEYGDDAMDSPEFDRDSYMISSPQFVNQRQRVKAMECWFRKPVTSKKFKGGPFKGEVFDVNNQAHVEAKQNGFAVANRVRMQMYVAIMVKAGLLYVGPSPYRHNRFPFTPIWCYRYGRTNLPYGVWRGMRDIQDSINKRHSKALHILSSNKVIMEEDAVEDIDEFREEISRPDAVIVKRKNAYLEINADRELAAAHLELMSRDINMLQQVGGVTDEQLGRETNATSGIAVQRRQEQGSLATAKVFDNLRLAFQLEGEIQLSLMEQFVDEQKTFRITNERGVPDYVTVNDGLPENDIIRAKADFIISEADWRASVRQAQTEQLIDMLTKMPPDIALVMFDLVVDGMDVPNREEIVKRIREISGQRDPDQTEPTPEDMARQQAQAEQQAFQKALAQAQLREQNAKAAKAEAEAGVAQMNAKQIAANIIGVNLTAHLTAVNAAREIVLTPGVVPVADALLTEAGWVDAVPTNIPIPHQIIQRGLPPIQQQPSM